MRSAPVSPAKTLLTIRSMNMRSRWRESSTCIYFSFPILESARSRMSAFRLPRETDSPATLPYRESRAGGVMPGRRADANDAIVGRNIRVHRLARKLSQLALATAIGISFQQLQKYEKGANRVGAGRLVRIANALGVPVMALLAGVPGVGRKTPVEPSAV